jgi:hypothetical protein
VPYVGTKASGACLRSDPTPTQARSKGGKKERKRKEKEMEMEMGQETKIALFWHEN